MATRKKRTTKKKSVRKKAVRRKPRISQSKLEQIYDYYGALDFELQDRLVNVLDNWLDENEDEGVPYEYLAYIKKLVIKRL